MYTTLLYFTLQDYENSEDFLKLAHHLLMEVDIINGDLVSLSIDVCSICNGIDDRTEPCMPKSVLH